MRKVEVGMKSEILEIIIIIFENTLAWIKIKRRC